jgi:hypothetical protein
MNRTLAVLAIIVGLMAGGSAANAASTRLGPPPRNVMTCGMPCDRLHHPIR